MAERPLPAGMSPRLLSRDQAAAYCGVGPELFERECAVPPIRIGSRKLWDVRAIDRWLDGDLGDGDLAGSIAGRLNGHQGARG